MRMALIVGIDSYSHASNLYGCVNDARAMKAALERNADGGRNFETKCVLGTDSASPILKSKLRDYIKKLFSLDCGIALFYFAGHGHVEETGGYILTSDAKSGDDGIPLADIMVWANRSPAANRIIVLDSCHSGIAGSRTSETSISELKEGTTIITASTEDQYATEQNNSGVFTSLFIDGLNGSAANIVGDVTPSSVYTHIEQSLGSWSQRPVFKANVKRFVTLCKVPPLLELSELRRITELFPHAGYEHQLKPSYEGTETDNEEHFDNFRLLSKYNSASLVKPVGTIYMWSAAMDSKACELTALGEHYRRLVERELI